MQHPCDKAHALLVRQLSAAEGCEKVGRRRRKSDISRSTCHLTQRFYGKQSKSPRKRTTAGAATFLVKVKVYRGEPANEEADIQVDKAISSKEFPRNGATGQIEQS